MTAQQVARPQVRMLVYINLIMALLNLGTYAVMSQDGGIYGDAGMWYVYLNLGFGVAFIITAMLIGAYLLIGLVIGLLVNGLFLAFTLLTLVGGTGINLFYLLRLLSAFALFYIIKYLVNRSERSFFR